MPCAIYKIDICLFQVVIRPKFFFYKNHGASKLMALCDLKGQTWF